MNAEGEAQPGFGAVQEARQLPVYVTRVFKSVGQWVVDIDGHHTPRQVEVEVVEEEESCERLTRYTSPSPALRDPISITSTGHPSNAIPGATAAMAETQVVEYAGQISHLR